MSFTPDIPGAEVRPSSKFWKGRKSAWPVSAVIQHFTAASGEEALVKWMENGSSTSAHLLIFRSGHVVQMVRFGDRAFHAGEKMGKGFWPAGTPQPTNVNQFSIGIENCNCGWLMKEGNSFYLPKKTANGWEKGRKYRKSGVPEEAEDHTGVMRWWEPYPKKLVEANIECLKRIVELYPAIDRDSIGFHSDVSPHRKTDPGPLWPHEYVLDQVFGTSFVAPPTLPDLEDDDDEDEDGDELEASRGDNAEGENPEWHYDHEAQMSMIDRVVDPDMCIEE